MASFPGGSLLPRPEIGVVIPVPEGRFVDVATSAPDARALLAGEEFNHGAIVGKSGVVFDPIFLEADKILAAAAVIVATATSWDDSPDKRGVDGCIRGHLVWVVESG